jgi:Tfp pilus assembly protein PilF
MGSLQMNMGDVRGALMTFEQAFKIDGHRAPLCYNLANAYMANNQVQEAIDKNERAISLDPSMLSAKGSLASLFAMQGRYQEKFLNFEKSTPLVHLRVESHGLLGS